MLLALFFQEEREFGGGKGVGSGEFDAHLHFQFVNHADTAEGGGEVDGDFGSFGSFGKSREVLLLLLLSLTWAPLRVPVGSFASVIRAVQPAVLLVSG